MSEKPFAESHGSFVVIGSDTLAIEINSYRPDHVVADRINAAVASLVAAARKEERERCAKVVMSKLENHDQDGSVCRKIGFCECFGYSTLEDIAAAIRALGD